MILTKTIIYRGREIDISSLKPSSGKKVLVECPICKQQRYANYGRVKDNQICHHCALKSLIKFLPIGNKYNRYTVINSGIKHGRSICKCDCGTIKEVDNYLLISGKTKSCGCFKSEKASYNMKITSQNQKRENHPMWKGGIASLDKLIRSLQEYKIWREECFKRDNYTCQDCGQVGYILNIHHDKIKFSELIKQFLQEYNQFSPIDDKETLVRLAITWKPFWELDNGKTLCKDCHNKISKFNKEILI